MIEANRSMCGAFWLSLTLLLGLLLTSGCQQEADAADQPFVPGGDPQRGAEAIQAYGCVSCHTIPGIPEADALVGPPLTGWAQRAYIAGAIPNTPENLIVWLQNPQLIEAGTAMPNMGVTEQDARDMGAYLYTLTDNNRNR